MHRILPNILFLLIIFMLATAFPLSTDILSLNLSTKIVENPIDEVIVEAKLELILPDTLDSMTLENISFEIQSTTGLFPNDLLNGYDLRISNHNIEIDKISLSELKPIISDGADRKKMITIPKNELLLTKPPGYYTFSLQNNEDSFEYTWFGTNITYDKILLGTSNASPQARLGFTLFYPTADYKNVVPITKFVAIPDNRWRSLYTALVNGPKPGLGLTELVPAIPYAPNIRISQNVANIYMYPANLIGYEEHYPLIMDAITKTFMTLGPLDGVKFYVSDSSATYSGSDLSQIYTQSTVSSAFLGYTHNSNYMMLFPFNLKSTTFEDRVQEIWQLLKLSDISLSEIQGIIQTLPDEIQLNDYSLDSGVLTLDVSETFNQLFNTEAEYQKLLIYSILYSYTSLPEVTSVKLTVNNMPVIREGFDFTNAITPDKFYNLEP